MQHTLVSVSADFILHSVGGDEVSVKLHCPNGPPITADVDDNDDGTYTASFTPIFKGDHQITVHIRGKPIQGSSFDLQVCSDFLSISKVCFGSFFEFL